MYTETMKERQALAFKAPSTLSNSAVFTPALRMDVLRRVRAYFQLGTLTGSASVNISLQASATSDGTFVNITTPTTDPVVTAVVTDDSLNCLEIRADQLPAGMPWVRAYAIETATANAVVGILLIGDESSYKPGNAYNTTVPTNDVVTVS